MTRAAARVPVSRVVCAGCGAAPPPAEPYPFRCENAGRDDVDHVLVRRLELDRVAFDSPAGDGAASSFLRHRGLLHSYHRALAGGWADADYAALLLELDRRVAGVAGSGFRPTPQRRDEPLGARLGLRAPGGIWVKDETGNVAGSHKGRHLMGVLAHLEVAERLGLADPARRPPLAIASCGNAALAAAVVARAGGRALKVFVPTDAPAGTVRQLADLGAEVVVCPREPGRPGDPSYHRLQAELAAGALPFTCQGNENGMAIEGGQTLGYELVAALTESGTADGAAGFDHVVVQVGGGALASAVATALAEAVTLGVLPRLPRLHAVQTRGAHPLERAYHRVRALLAADAAAADVRAPAPAAADMPAPAAAAADGADIAPLPPDLVAAAVATAARHRSRYMWPWETEPKSLATGILDDETYDWQAVVAGMLSSGGRPVVVDEDTVAAAHAMGTAAGYPVDPTGSAGLAGVMALRADGTIAPTDTVAVLFTGVARSG